MVSCRRIWNSTFFKGKKALFGGGGFGAEGSHQRDVTEHDDLSTTQGCAPPASQPAPRAPPVRKQTSCAPPAGLKRPRASSASQHAPRAPTASQQAPRAPPVSQQAPCAPTAGQKRPRASPASQHAPHAPTASQHAAREPTASQQAPRAPTASQQAPREPTASQQAPRAPTTSHQAPCAPTLSQQAPRAPVSSSSSRVPENQRQVENEQSGEDNTPQSDRRRSISTKTHGSSSTSDVVREPSSRDRRILLSVKDNGSLCPSHEIGQSFLQCFETRWFPEGYAWEKLSKQQKHFYFNEFKKRFCWREEDEVFVEKKFMKWASRRYSDTLTKTKKGLMKRKMPDEIWKEWEVGWQSDQYKKVSEINSLNRKSEHAPNSGPSTHTCGSRSMEDHREDLARMLGEEPDPYDLFVYTHSSKDEKGNMVPCCEKAAQFGDEYHASLEIAKEEHAAEIAEGCTEEDVVDTKKIYYDVSQNMMKKSRCRVYGVGDCAARYYPDSFGNSATCSRVAGLSQQDFQQLRSDLRRELIDEVRKEVRVEQTQNLQNEMQTWLQTQLTRMLREGWQPPPTHVTGSSGASASVAVESNDSLQQDEREKGFD